MNTTLLLLLAGVVGGMINSIAGGGGVLMFPALLATGLPAIIANATSSLVVWPGALTSAWGYRRELRKIPRVYLLLLIPALLGAIVGAVTLVHTSSVMFEKLAPWLVVFAVILLALQPKMHDMIIARSGRQLKRHPLRLIFTIGCLVFPLAVYGGYFGVGYGIVVLALLGLTNLKSVHQMNGIKNLSGAVINIFATTYFALHHLINWRSGLIMALGTSLGGILGARLALRTPAKLVHNLTVVIGLIIALVLLVKTYV